MSVRFDAAADRLSNQGSYPVPASGFTVTAWIRIRVDRNNWSTFFRIHSTGTLVTFGTDSDGMQGPYQFTPVNSVGIASNISSAVDIWCPVATTRSTDGATLRVYRQVDGNGTTQTNSVGGMAGQVTGTPSGICIGGRGGEAGASNDSAEWFNGEVEQVRYFNTELSQAQIEAEWASPTPVLTASLFENWTLADATDLTGTVLGRVLVTQTGGSPTTGATRPPNVSAGSNLTGSATDPVGITDSIAAASAYAPAPTDAVGLADTASPAAAYVRALTEAVGLTDAISWTMSRAFADTGSAADAFMVAQGRDVTDAVGLTDSISWVKTTNYEITDAVGLVDDHARALAYGRLVADAVGIVDTALSQGGTPIGPPGPLKPGAPLDRVTRLRAGAPVDRVTRLRP